MGRLVNVGHDKLLTGLACFAPLLAPIAKAAFDIAAFLAKSSDSKYQIRTPSIRCGAVLVFSEGEFNRSARRALARNVREWIRRSGKIPSRERAIIQGTVRPGLRKPSSHRDPLPLAVSYRFIARHPGVRQGAHHAENLPKP
jgi:hypothetical protein